MKYFKKLLSGALAVAVTLTSVIFASPAITAMADGYDTGIPEFHSVNVELLNPDAEGNATKDSQIKVTFNAEDDVAITYATVGLYLYESGDGYRVVDSKWSYYDLSGSFYGSEITKDGNNFATTISLSDWDYNGKVELTDITIKDGGNNSRSYSFYESEVPHSWTIKGNQDAQNTNSANNSDNWTRLTINDYSLVMKDDKGNVLAPGTLIKENTNVNYELTINEAIPDEIDKFSLYYRVGLDYASDYLETDLIRQANSKVFKGSIKFTSDKYPTLWLSTNCYWSDWNEEMKKGVAYQLYLTSDVTSLLLKVGNQIVIPTNSYTAKFSWYEWNSTLKYYENKTKDIKNQIPVFTALGNTDVPVIKAEDGTVFDWVIDNYKWNSTTNKNELISVTKYEDYKFTSGGSDTVLYARLDTKGYRPVEIIYPLWNGSSGIAYEAAWLKGENKAELEASIKKYMEGKVPASLGEYTVSFAQELSESYSSVVYASVVPDYCIFNFYNYYLGVEDGKLDIKRDVVASIKKKVGQAPTVEEVTKAIDKTNPDKVTGINFIEWKFDEDSLKSMVADWNERMADYLGVGSYELGYTTLYATYDKDIVSVSYFYYDEEKEHCYFIDSKYSYMEKGADEDAVFATVSTKSVLGFSDWDKDMFYCSEPAKSGIRNCTLYTKKLSSIAEINEALLNGTLHNNSSDSEESASEETVTEVFETKVEEQKVEEKSDGKVQVTQEIKVGKDNIIVEDGVKKMDDTAKTVIVDAIAKALEETAAQQAADKKTERPKVTFKTEATVIPTDILEAAKGQDIDVVFEMEDGISWTINGKDINGESLKDVNLQVNKNTNAVPSYLLDDSLGKDVPNIQINLADHGLFGFTANLRIYVGKEYANKYANLFYYTKDNRLEVQNSNPVDADGYATLAFTHASDYVIAMGEDMTKAKIADSKNTATPAAAPATGDASTAILWMLMLVLGLSLFVSVNKKSIYK